MNEIFQQRGVLCGALIFGICSAAMGAQDGTPDKTKSRPVAVVSKPALPAPPAGDSLPAKGLEEGAAPGDATVITALKRTKFDPKQNKVVFLGSVLLEDPRFVLKCDALTAFLKKSAFSEKKRVQEKGESGASAGGDGVETKPPQATVAKKVEEEPKSSGGLETAEAEGNVEIVQDRVTPEGKAERNVIRARKAVYHSATEAITLTGWPQVWQSHNGNSLKALREDTVMVLNKSGDVDVTGPTKSVFVNPNKNAK